MLLHAQSLERTVILNSGWCETIGTDYYNFTVGEAVMGSDLITIPNLTMGFLQPIDQSLLEVNEISLSARWEDQSVALEWQTSGVQKGDRFLVHQILLDGSRRLLIEMPGSPFSTRYDHIDYQSDLSSSELVFQVVWVDALGRSTLSNKVKLIREPTSISWNVYPNPTQDQLFIQLEGPVTFLQIQLVDMNGRVIALNHWDNEFGRFRVHLGEMAAGVYILHIRTPEAVLRKEIQIIP